MVVVLPFAGFLLRNSYPLIRTEAVAALLLLLVTSAVLAVSCRGTFFYAAVLACGTVISAVPVQRALSPLCRAPLAAVIAGLVIATGGLMLWLHERYFEVLLVFSLGAFATHGVMMFSRPGLPVPHPAAVALGATAPAHFLYLLLDEHMGPAGLPESVPESRRAASEIRSTFRRYGFRLYPNAYSNYPTTFESVPSILNGTLTRHRDVAPPDAYGVSPMDAHGFFENFRARGYRVFVFQDARLNYTRGEAAQAVEYSDELNSVARAGWPWQDKLRVIAGTYQASDRVLSRFKGLFPLFRFGARALTPFSAPPNWPSWLAGEIAAANTPTIFFAHLLLPHGPYVFRRDGSVRPLNEWRDDQRYGVLDQRAYQDRYARYAEQIEFVQSQLETLFSLLRGQGVLDRMTVVVHGDHGSRIRLRQPSISDGPSPYKPDGYDYTGTPPLSDLLDRFSALLAIKLPGERVPSCEPRKESVMRVLSEVIYRRDASLVPPGADSVFLFDEQGNSKEIKLLDLWNN